MKETASPSGTRKRQFTAVLWMAFSLTFSGPAGAGINRFVLACMGRLQGAEHILSGAGARVDETGSAQFFKGVAIKWEPLAL